MATRIEESFLPRRAKMGPRLIVRHASQDGDMGAMVAPHDIDGDGDISHTAGIVG